mmetsp:Transcript_107145/g.309864  ORF Transcript_107145/g.309864 Transcript_107145/m.309864 type:complete len:425 (-) Transcript_107145:475-1749(-)
MGRRRVELRRGAELRGEDLQRQEGRHAHRHRRGLREHVGPPYRRHVARRRGGASSDRNGRLRHREWLHDLAAGCARRCHGLGRHGRRALRRHGRGEAARSAARIRRHGGERGPQPRGERRRRQGRDPAGSRRAHGQARRGQRRKEPAIAPHWAHRRRPRAAAHRGCGLVGRRPTAGPLLLPRPLRRDWRHDDGRRWRKPGRRRSERPCVDRRLGGGGDRHRRPLRRPPPSRLPQQHRPTHGPRRSRESRRRGSAEGRRGRRGAHGLRPDLQLGWRGERDAWANLDAARPRGLRARRRRRNDGPRRKNTRGLRGGHRRGVRGEVRHGGVRPRSLRRKSRRGDAPVQRWPAHGIRIAATVSEDGRAQARRGCRRVRDRPPPMRLRLPPLLLRRARQPPRQRVVVEPQLLQCRVVLQRCSQLAATLR